MLNENQMLEVAVTFVVMTLVAFVCTSALC